MKRSPQQIVLAFALGLSLFAAPAGAAPADRKVVMELMHLVMPQSVYEAMIDQTATQMLAQLQRSGAQVPPDASKKLKAAVLEAVPYAEQLNWSADLYQQKFTTDEIGDLKRFYESPTGKKAARLLPEMSGEVGKRMGEVLPQRLGPALKKHGLTP